MEQGIFVVVVEAAAAAAEDVQELDSAADFAESIEVAVAAVDLDIPELDSVEVAVDFLDPRLAVVGDAY